MKKRLIVTISVVGMVVVLVSAICIHQVKNVQANEEDRVALDSSYFTDNPEELNKRYADYLERENENYLLEVKGIEDVNVSVTMDGEDIKLVIVDVKFDEAVLSESEQEDLKNDIVQFLKSFNENADVTLNVLN